MSEPSRCERGGKIRLTMVTQKKESAGAEVAVELEQDVIGRAGNGLLRRAAAELTDLWGCLIRAIPKGDNRSVQSQIWHIKNLLWLLLSADNTSGRCVRVILIKNVYENRSADVSSLQCVSLNGDLYTQCKAFKMTLVPYQLKICNSIFFISFIRKT